MHYPPPRAATYVRPPRPVPALAQKAATFSFSRPAAAAAAAAAATGDGTGLAGLTQVAPPFVSRSGLPGALLPPASKNATRWEKLPKVGDSPKSGREMEAEAEAEAEAELEGGAREESGPPPAA